MKLSNERAFVKTAYEELKIEVRATKIIILESSITDGELDYVMFQDRFGRQWQVYKKNNKYSTKEYIKK